MIRDFSEEKKKELYEALEIVDNKEWKNQIHHYIIIQKRW